METVTLARNAMATRFELVLHGGRAASLRAAGEEALDEIDRLEAQLSLFRPSSEIAHLNLCAARERVRVTPPLFSLLEHAGRLHEESGGAFDITVAPLMRCWGFIGGSGTVAQPEEVAAAKANVGMHLLRLHPEDFTVEFTREGVMLDLGAIGKGYAIERAVELLREAGVTSALVHGGTSTIYAIGHPPEADRWEVALPNPADPMLDPATSCAPPGQSPKWVRVPLRDEAISVSAVWGKFFESGNRTFGHVIDPRTGEPVQRAVLAVVVLPSATETDALSTALLTLGLDGHDRICGLRPGMRALVVAREGEGFVSRSTGIETLVT
jgi:FAD:protein FMN transferase